MAYVAVVVQARLAAGGTQLEDAARDLGCTAWGAMMRITVPLAAPALVSGWLLAFTVSLDDLVVASFVSGPGATTLPMLMFSSLRLGATPALAAVGTLLLCALLVLLAGAVSLRKHLRL
jgi:putrescine transport system permease protein